jgi:ribosomal protein S18 acetylase RimI-like enzyme
MAVSRSGPILFGFRQLRPGVKPDENQIDGVLKSGVPQSEMADRNSLFEQMAAYHPATPHWYLPIIGVGPIYQRRGLGTALMRHGPSLCDEEHMPAYLESTNPAWTGFYEQLGFEAVGAIRAGDSPPMVPMLRAAR